MANLAGEHNTAPTVTESISESSQSYGKPASRHGSPETVKVDGNKSLTLASENLILNDPTANKSKRTCGFAGFGASAPAMQSVPLYNVLWAEQTGKTLTIDYAKQVSTQRVQAAKWTFTVNDADGPDVRSWIDTLMTRAYGPAKRCKRAKVLVNPHAGPGGAEKKWRVDVEPLFKAARMPMDVDLTTFSGQALAVSRDVDVDAFDTIVTCSGDGLAHEAFNGLGQRPDASRALQKIAISHIPCGSGNAMSCNLYDSHRPSICALAIIKGVETPVDLISITQGNRRTLSFLSQALGVVAESDLATEHLRWMGGARFTWGFLTRIFEKKCYPCDLAVKVEIGDKAGVKRHYKEHTRRALATHTGAGEPPRAENADGASSPSGDQEGLPPLRYGTINDDLPDGWELIPYQKMGNFYCGNMGYMAPNANFFAAALPNDGLMDLVCVDGDVSIGAQVSLLTSVESGKFFDNPVASYRKISAYRIIPRNQKSGYISIDGEKVPFEPFQAEVHRGLGKVISKRGKYEAPGPLGWEKMSLA
ncbi:diacylglycerol kinase catalytic domain-containing protein [Colletotrichum orchidophilum]|uniref:Diacylglycerol kinase catalytic domain-containing protein n=1 Tax=Colletotrichum orchidophilum TaxID=1209926 RepID=A0A1G4AZA3_9PEZI|nr:diacylglycerol kinase catalytic domain-containing protein [Colletotrichum orchidophilum]OHE94500.1 diacylglycerol kinase catalytic domain-containing protein [Colletotrichum orchidophilum]